MNLEELLSPARICFSLQSNSKSAVINELADLLDNDGKLSNKPQFIQAVLKREEEYTTGIGMGIAIPHGKDESVNEPALVFGISQQGIDYQSLDGTPAHIFFLIAVPPDSETMHLEVLSHISRKLMHQEVRDKLMAAVSYKEVLAAFQ